MQELTALILRAQTGDARAFDLLVLRFQDMVVAYAYSSLGNLSDAEDAAQEAFIEAHRCLASLQEPLAFSRWLRRIVWKHCDRILRQQQLLVVAMEVIEEEGDANDEPAHVLEQRERAEQVRNRSGGPLASYPRQSELRCCCSTWVSTLNNKSASFWRCQ